MRIQRISGVIACTALLSLAACADSTGPNNLDANSALQSLRLALGGITDIETPGVAAVNASLGVISPLLDQINVTVDGKSQTMFGLGVRESYPDGTCEETIFPDPEFPSPPGQCTPMSLGVILLLWQSHSATAPPDRLMLIGADEGTANFDFGSLPSVPGVAFYIEGTNLWISTSGTLTSHVAASGSTCTIPPPPYAKSATCTLATFNEQGTITLESDAPGASAHKTLSIAPQTVDGLWLAITEVQPVTSLRAAAPLRGLLRF